MLTYDAFGIIISLIGGVAMSFQLKPNKKETENKTIRFPMPLIDRIEDAIKNQDVTFSSFVIQACEYALNDMDNDKKANKYIYIKTKKRCFCMSEISLFLLIMQAWVCVKVVNEW